MQPDLPVLFRNTADHGCSPLVDQHALCIVGLENDRKKRFAPSAAIPISSLAVGTSTTPREATKTGVDELIEDLGKSLGQRNPYKPATRDSVLEAQTDRCD